MNMTIRKTSNTYYLILMILMSCFIINNILYLRNYVLYSYNLNLYNHLPVLFWIAYFLTYAIGVFILLYKCPSYIKKACILLLIINYMVFLVTPGELGYSILGDGLDDISYLGEINRIIETGKIDSLDIYPIAFILSSIYALINNADIYSLPQTIPTIISLLFITGIILLGGILNNRKGYLYILMPVCLIYYLRYMHFSLAPHYIFFSLTPLGIFIIVKIIKSRLDGINHLGYSILATIIIVVVTIGHPYIFIFWVFLLVYFLYSFRLNAEIKKQMLNLFFVISSIFITFVIYNSYSLRLFGDTLSRIFLYTPNDPVIIQGYKRVFSAFTIDKLIEIVKNVVLYLLKLIENLVVPMLVLQ
jgi:hypothetical protein